MRKIYIKAKYFHLRLNAKKVRTITNEKENEDIRKSKSLKNT